MSAWIIPLAFAILVWWFSTGVILWLDGFSKKFFRPIFFVSCVILFFAFWGISISSTQDTVLGAYCAFTCAILIWGWQELAFLLGYITGSRRVLCPSDAKGWQRAWFAFQTINHHELALLVLGIVLAIVHIDAANTTGLWAFVILWVMRQSAKINIFLGVLNLNERFLPDHLKYLQTYFRRRPMNYLMPFSVVLAVLVVTPLWIDIFTATESAFALTSKTLLATLLSLGILEHILLVLPFSSEGLWKWGFREGR